MMKLLRAARLVRRDIASDRRIVAALVLSLVSVVFAIVLPLIMALMTNTVFAGVIGGRLPAGQSLADAVDGLREAGRGDLANVAETSGAVPGAGMDWPRLWRETAFAVAVIVVMTGARAIGSILLSRAVAESNRRTRSEMDRKLHRLPVSAFEGGRRGATLNAVTVDVANLGTLIGPLFVQLPVIVMTVVGVAVVLLVIAPLLAVIVFVAVPVTVVAALVLMRRARPHIDLQWQTTAELAVHVEDVYSAREMLSSYDAHREPTAEFDRLNTRIANATRTGQTWSGALGPVLSGLNVLVFVALAVVGAMRMLDGAITLGALQAVVIYARQMTAPLSELAGILPRLQSGMVSYGRVKAFLAQNDESQPAVDDPPTGSRGRHTAPPAISFEGVRFAYGGGPGVLADVDLQLEPGTATALVGATGSGKTTLTSLLQRFADPTAGRITLDGYDIAECSRTFVRSQLAVVTQEPRLFTGTAGENIAFGSPDGRTERSAVIDEITATLASGEDTAVSGDSEQLSAGEKQLLTVARALAARPGVLILDEATSAADPRTELLIQRGLEALRTHTTTLVITHRMSTLAAVDDIAVLGEGRIVERGTAAELISAGGEFARLYGADR
ncbi:ABC transporter ATP-binding protein [Gordonia zhaorongruii]|uniref:ABC transporter ATP-binding protein n=1 Tax=Gordonia zhaorongruii TaxID=2597659 RepID=UPI001F410AD0|nr:ABC transporter ATP-binding protein [Gordonia zhaorongruii]